MTLTAPRYRPSARLRLAPERQRGAPSAINQKTENPTAGGATSDHHGGATASHHGDDPARTVVDILDAPRLGGGIRHAAEILAAYLDDHEPAILVEYGDRLGNRTVFKRLGYIVEALGQERADLIAACHERISAGFALLDPDGPDGGHYVSRWGLRVNVRLGPEEPS